jgi:Nif-specific regulatory protein
MSSQEFQTLSSLLSVLSDPRQSKSAIASAIRLLVELTETEAAAILTVPAGEDVLNLVASEGLTPTQFRRLNRQASKGSFTDLLNEGGAEIKEMDSSISRSDTLDPESDPGWMLSSPIQVADKAMGLVLVTDGNREKLSRLIPLMQGVCRAFAQHIRTENAVFAEQSRLVEENTKLKSELKEKHDFSQLIGNSNEMRLVFDQVVQVAKSNATVLLRGESGTGKEMIANAIHYNSLRAKQPLIKVNCSALPETLIESELFGYEKGAFTGAEKRKIGRFESADGGTIFLDEIGELPLKTQVKLLRVLQEKEFQRLGSNDTIRANVRIIAATNMNLESAMDDGRFREDLFYRLNIFSIFLPPLRERKADILLLAEHFLEKYESEYVKRIRRISTPAIDMLTQYHFPGNVRELENVIERAVIVCDSNVIHSHHLPLSLQTAEETDTSPKGSLDASVAALEKDLILDALKSARGNVAKAARLLDSTERKIGYKIRKFGLEPSKFK